ncbi:MAG: NAD(P)H-hydrate dehydratase [Dehalococcoidia bacterium]|jgi:NAD(P)H-hydrate epimerase
MKIVTAEEMRRIDQECIREGTPASVLMENAGKAVAEETRAFLGKPNGRNILCLIGAGNNGGDGLVAARYLGGWGAKVSVYLCSKRPVDDENLKLLHDKNITCIESASDADLEKFDNLLKSANCVVDGILGTGKMRPLTGVFQQVLERVNEAKAARQTGIVAIDIPSGMDADTGAVDDACPYADVTVTLAFPKPGLFSFPGAARTGKLKIADIGIAESFADDISLELIDDKWARSVLPQRPPDANKGTFGKLLVAAGSINYSGAAYLACSGAMRAGAGLVTLATAASLQPVLAAKLTEATYLSLPESQPGVISVEAAGIIADNCPNYDSLLMGCGLGKNPATADFVNSLIEQKFTVRMILDADALNIIAGDKSWGQKLNDEVILTPHPGEMSRLCGLPIEEIQSDRINIAKKYAAEWRKTVVLKGAYSVIATADGRCRVSPYANPGLASAGTGDVLAGVIAGLSTQGLAPFDAASLGVYLHGTAGEMVRDILGDTGMIASDLLTALPVIIKQLKENTNPSGG